MRADARAVRAIAEILPVHRDHRRAERVHDHAEQNVGHVPEEHQKFTVLTLLLVLLLKKLYLSLLRKRRNRCLRGLLRSLPEGLISRHGVDVFFELHLNVGRSIAHVDFAALEDPLGLPRGKPFGEALRDCHRVIHGRVVQRVRQVIFIGKCRNNVVVLADVLRKRPALRRVIEILDDQIHLRFLPHIFIGTALRHQHAHEEEQHDVYDRGTEFAPEHLQKSLKYLHTSSSL